MTPLLHKSSAQCVGLISDHWNFYSLSVFLVGTDNPIRWSSLNIMAWFLQGPRVLQVRCCLSWDEWRLSDREVERIDLENAANPEEADELEEMSADEMAVDGYYVVAGIAGHEYKQG